jgi:hypothetical protein
MTATRRLAAILAADIARYLRLMGAQKRGSLAALRMIGSQMVRDRRPA